MRPPAKPEIRSLRQSREFQRQMAEALFLPLTSNERLRLRFPDGRRMADFADSFVRPNDRLTSFERLEIYSRSYWFRVLNCFHEDFPGLRAVLGPKAFDRLAEAYLARYPSESFTLRDLGSRIERFLREEPQHAGRRFELALDMARFEWAQVEAFDGPSRPALRTEDFAGANPSKLRLGLQPHMTLLACEYPVDEFAMAVKRQHALRNDASNAKAGATVGRALKKIMLPRRRPVHLAIHRQENRVYIKRLDEPAFMLFSALRQGATVEDACAKALTALQKGETPDPSAFIGKWFETGASLGWFCRHSKIKK